MKYDLIIISGPAAAGKTTLAQKILEKLNVVLITKDDIKLVLFETLGWSDREWSKKLGAASMALLYSALEKQLKAGHQVIIESDFKPEIDKKKIQDLVDKYKLSVIELHCFADEKILFERSKQRVADGQRHPGHSDHATFEEFTAAHNNTTNAAINVSEVVEIDTGTSTINYQEILQKIGAV